MSGQVGQNEALAGANPNASGLGTNILLSTAPFIDDAFEMFAKNAASLSMTMRNLKKRQQKLNWLEGG